MKYLNKTFSVPISNNPLGKSCDNCFWKGFGLTGKLNCDNCTSGYTNWLKITQNPEESKKKD